MRIIPSNSVCLSVHSYKLYGIFFLSFFSFLSFLAPRGGGGGRTIYPRTLHCGPHHHGAGTGTVNGEIPGDQLQGEGTFTYSFPGGEDGRVMLNVASGCLRALAIPRLPLVLCCTRCLCIQAAVRVCMRLSNKVTLPWRCNRPSPRHHFCHSTSRSHTPLHPTRPQSPPP